MYNASLGMGLCCLDTVDTSLGIRLCCMLYYLQTSWNIFLIEYSAFNAKYLGSAKTHPTAAHQTCCSWRVCSHLLVPCSPPDTPPVDGPGCHQRLDRGIPGQWQDTAWGTRYVLAIHKHTHTRTHTHTHTRAQHTCTHTHMHTHTPTHPHTHPQSDLKSSTCVYRWNVIHYGNNMSVLIVCSCTV